MKTLRFRTFCNDVELKRAVQFRRRDERLGDALP